MVPIENWGVGVGWGLELTDCSPQQSPIQQVDPFCKRVSQVPDACLESFERNSMRRLAGVPSPISGGGGTVGSKK
jgi:hypothetical protein